MPRFKIIRDPRSSLVRTKNGRSALRRSLGTSIRNPRRRCPVQHQGPRNLRLWQVKGRPFSPKLRSAVRVDSFEVSSQPFGERRHITKQFGITRNNSNELYDILFSFWGSTSLERPRKRIGMPELCLTAAGGLKRLMERQNHFSNAHTVTVFNSHTI